MLKSASKRFARSLPRSSTSSCSDFSSHLRRIPSTRPTCPGTKSLAAFSSMCFRPLSTSSGLKTTLNFSPLLILVQEAFSFFPKYALHGFWGPVTELLKLYRDKSNEYLSKHMTKIREAIRQNKQARVMDTRPRRLGINWENEAMPCGLTMNEALKQKELCVAPRCYECAYMQNF